MFEKLRKRLTKIESAVGTISVLLVFFMLIGKFVGLLKPHFMAQLFGLSQEYDVFRAAFVLPDFVFSLLVVGTVNAALVPVFMKVLNKEGEKELHHTFNTVATLLLGIMIGALGLLYFALPPIAQFLFERKELLHAVNISLTLSQGSFDYYEHLFVNLSRLMLVSPLLLAVSSVFGAYLQAHKRFIATALAPVLYNVGQVTGILLFAKFAPQYGVYALGYSVLLGSLLHFITQFVAVYLLNQDISWTFKITPYIKEIFKLSLPRVFGLGVEQIAIMFNSFWCFTLGVGALSVYSYASSIQTAPVDLLSGSFLQAIFPHLNEKARQNDNYQALNKLYTRALILLCFIGLPIIVLMLVLRLPLVRLILGTGRFTWPATLMTSFTLAFFTPAILLQALAALNIRTFYAIHNTKTPFIVSIVGVVMNIAFSIICTNLFSHYAGVKTTLATLGSFSHAVPTLISWMFVRNGSFAAVAGLAFGISLGLIIEVWVSFSLLSKKIGIMAFWKQHIYPIRSLQRLALGFAGSLVATYFAYKLFDQFVDTTHTWGVILISALTSLSCGIVYILLTYKVWKMYLKKDRLLKLIGRKKKEEPITPVPDVEEQV